MRIRELALIAAALATAAPAHAALVIAKRVSSANVNCVAGTCTATAADAVLSLDAVKRLIRQGNLTIASGSLAQDIEFEATLEWSQRTTLTFDAFHAITFDAALEAQGKGGVTLVTNDGGSGGDITFAGKGKISFLNLVDGHLTINTKRYRLVNDIASLAAGIAAHPAGAFALANGHSAIGDGTYTSSPIPTVYSGTFEGLGHTIANLHIEPVVQQTQVGLFADITTGGVVRDLYLANETIDAGGSGSQIGGLVGFNAGTIDNVSVAVAMTTRAQAIAGGLAGWNEGSVLSSASSGNILSRSKGVTAGGLVGHNQSSIANSHSSAAVSGQIAGGLAAFNEGSIVLSSATGAVGADKGQTTNPSAGGLVGVNEGTIDRSFATGAVFTGDGSVGQHHSYFPSGGGLVGVSTGTVTNVYATGAVSVGAYSDGGGLLADAAGSVSFSYSTGTVGDPGTETKLGGWAGDASNSGTGDYWDTDTSATTSGCATPDCPATGLTTAQFQSGLPSGFDPAIWGENAGINGGLPYLLANPPQ